MAVDPARAKSLFLAASELPAVTARAAFLERECAGDPDLRARVEALLRANDEAPLPPPRPGDATDVHAPDAAPETPDYAEPAPRIGSVLAGKYKLVEDIGEGGMGSVYMALQTEPVKRAVAVKVVKAGMDSKAVLARFEAERQALAMMDHPNIARVFDAGVAPDGRPFFAMELVKGVPITQFCDARRLTLRERLELFIPVCNAIQHAHQKGVVHRDIKPSNVLVALYDDKPVPKVIDFGVAKATGQPLTDRTLATGFGAVVGTPEYMSPEQAGFNNLDVDTRSDVYALGVLLYELLAGSPPFSRADLQKAGVLEILRVIREQEPARPSTKLSTDAALPSLSANRGTEPGKLTRLLRGELDWIVLKALEKDRNRRYESANGFAADVQRYLAGEPVQAVPPTAGYRLRKWVRRNRVVVITVAVIWLVTLAQVGFSTVQWLKADSARAAEVRERQKADAARVEAEEHRAQAEAQRKLAEYRAAAVMVAAALEAMGRTDTREGLVRLAGTLKGLPPDATALRQGVVTNLLVWGQHIAPASRSITNSLHAVSPDGRVCLIAPNGSWEARDLITSKLLARLGGEDATTGGPFPADWRRSATFSADGRLVATLHTPQLAAEPTVRVWDAATWRERFRLRPAKLTYEVQLNRDGSRLATRSDTASAERTNDPDRLRTVVHLWDARTGERVATLDHGAKPVKQLDFTSDGSVLASTSGRVVRLWSAADGRLLHTLDKHAVSVDLVAFSPSGKTLAVAAGPRVYWWNVADGTPAGPSVGLEFALYPSDLDEVIRFAFETEDLLIVRVWNLHGVSFGRRTGGAVCIRGEVKPDALDAICSDGRYVLTEDWHVYSLSPFRRLETPPGRKFPPEVLAASGGRRYVQVGTEFLDLVAEVRVGGELNRPETRIHPVRAAGFGFAIEGDWSYGRFSGPVLVPAPAVLPPDEVLELWARVLARGRIDPDSGLFKPDDEATWERNRRELVGRAEPAGEFPFPGAFASDPLFWLRRAYKETKMEDSLPLVERLVAAEPSWQNYLHRAYVYSYVGRGLDAIRDDLRARELAKDEFEPDPDERGNGAPGAVHSILKKADRPKGEYELALRWLEASDSDDANLRALALYRLGRAEEALRALAVIDVPRVTDVAGGLMSPWAALAVGRAHGEALGREWRGNATVPLLIEALCHQKLGRPDAARRCLTVARELLRERVEDADLHRGNYGYESVVDEALRVVKPRE